MISNLNPPLSFTWWILRSQIKVLIETSESLVPEFGWWGTLYTKKGDSMGKPNGRGRGRIEQWLRAQSSHKKEWNNAFFRDMNGPRDCHIEWSQREERQIAYDTTYTWTLKNRCKWTYPQNRKRATEVENKFTLTRRKGEGGKKMRDWDWYIDTTIHKINN